LKIDNLTFSSKFYYLSTIKQSFKFDNFFSKFDFVNWNLIFLKFDNFFQNFPVFFFKLHFFLIIWKFLSWIWQIFRKFFPVNLKISSKIWQFFCKKMKFFLKIWLFLCKFENIFKNYSISLLQFSTFSLRRLDGQNCVYCAINVGFLAVWIDKRKIQKDLCR
jgi:hypothetical protein